MKLDKAPMHDIRYDMATARLFLAASGFWDESELDTFMSKVRVAFGDLANLDRPIAILADLRDLLPQSKHVFARPGFLQAAALIRIEQHAVVTSSALLRLQFRRFFNGIPTEFFESREAALAWLRWKTTDPLVREDVRLPSEKRSS